MFDYLTIEIVVFGDMSPSGSPGLIASMSRLLTICDGFEGRLIDQALFAYNKGDECWLSNCGAKLNEYYLGLST